MSFENENLFILLQKIENSSILGKWNEDAKDTLETIIDKLRNGDWIFDRYTPEEHRGFVACGEAGMSAAIILRGSRAAYDKISTGSRRGSSQGSRNQKCQTLKEFQESIIELWSKATGHWVDGAIEQELKTKYGAAIEGASESYVYFDGNSVVKANDPDALYNTDLQPAFDRIVLNNVYFPAANYTIEGFGRTYFGQFIILLRQPLIIGRIPEQHEIEDYFASLDMIRESPFSYHDDRVVISDMKVENAFIVSNPDEGDVDSFIAFDGNFSFVNDEDYLNESISAVSSS